MSKVKSVLGKGLEALIPSIADEHPRKEPTVPVGSSGVVAEAAVQEIPVALINPNPYQPREEFDAGALEELTNSIIEHGIIQPVTVRRAGEGFELIAGERRLRAAKAAGLAAIPAFIREVTSDEELLELALIENVQREHLNPMEVAAGYQRLIDDCHLTQDDVARKVSKDRTTVTNLLRLLKLPGEIQDSVRRGEISPGHGRALVNIASRDLQLAVWRQVVSASLSVRRTEALARRAISGTFAPAKRKLRKRTQSPATSPAFTAVASRLRSILATQVHVRDGEDGKGEIVIEFYSGEELERLLEMFESLELR
jgi:ParB family chromosome partitioning protein